MGPGSATTMGSRNPLGTRRASGRQRQHSVPAAAAALCVRQCRLSRCHGIPAIPVHSRGTWFVIPGPFSDGPRGPSDAHPLLSCVASRPFLNNVTSFFQAQAGCLSAHPGNGLVARCTWFSNPGPFSDEPRRPSGAHPLISCIASQPSLRRGDQLLPGSGRAPYRPSGERSM
jgi:hypothetical protein